ncbi:MAG: hypothetical protein CSB33_05100 [Desulfobacterales bacterium]|nr:MAG: hypothetical protein CSB33_05100 [Desulfobacterales bacterium]
MTPYAEDNLKIDISLKRGVTWMDWLGRSDNRNPGLSLGPYLSRLVDELSRKDVVMRFTDLEYMNSSTVPPLIRFMKHLDDRQIRTRILFDKDSRWQRASFKALESLVIRMQHVQIIGCRKGDESAALNAR